MTLRQPTERHGGNARFDEEVTIMVSKAAASLDIWLAQAEEVLRERRQQSLSSSPARSRKVLTGRYHSHARHSAFTSCI